MSDFAIAHVEAAIRHRNLSRRVLIGLMATGGIVAVAVAAADHWSATQTLAAPSVPAEATPPGWPDLATKALGHFAFAFLIATLMAAIYEMIAMRHLRAIARQVRSGRWLRRGEAISLRRDWMGASDDLDQIVGALNEARAYGVETRSALAWRVGQQRSAEAGLREDLAAAAQENDMLRSDLSEQADFARLLARDLDVAAQLAKDRLAGPVKEAAIVEGRDGGSTQISSNVLSLIGPDDISGMHGKPEAVDELAAEFAAYCAASDGRLSRVALALDEVLDVAIRDLRPRMQGLGASVEVSDLSVVEGDRALLIRLFSSLIRDALEAAGPGDPVQIRIREVASPDKGRVGIRVEDNCGRVLSGRGGGDDVALQPDRGLRTWAMCHRIVQAHGGQISEHRADAGVRSVQIELERI